ncbi:hypothetical protein D3C83_214370 [compost metagenome]
MCRTTYQKILSLGTSCTFTNTPSRWMEEMATMEAATFSFSVPASSLPIQLNWSPLPGTSSCETKFS